MERDTLRIKFDQLRSGKTFEEVDQGLDVQVHHFSLKFMYFKEPQSLSLVWLNFSSFKCII